MSELIKRKRILILTLLALSMCEPSPQQDFRHDTRQRPLVCRGSSHHEFQPVGDRQQRHALLSLGIKEVPDGTRRDRSRHRVVCILLLIYRPCVVHWIIRSRHLQACHAIQEVPGWDIHPLTLCLLLALFQTQCLHRTDPLVVAAHVPFPHDAVLHRELTKAKP